MLWVPAGIPFQDIEGEISLPLHVNSSGIISPSLNPSAWIEIFSIYLFSFAMHPVKSNIIIINNVSLTFILLKFTFYLIQIYGFRVFKLYYIPGFFCGFFQLVQDKTDKTHIRYQDNYQSIRTCFVYYKLFIICFNNN